MNRPSSFLLLVGALAAMPLALSGQAPETGAVDNSGAREMQYEAEDFIKFENGKNLGEVLGVALNSKGDVFILNHPGTATTGPLYGNATTEILQYDSKGRFVREIGHGVYALGYSHSIRIDRYDNIWVVDKGTDSVIKFAPNGKVLMNLGRRAEGFDSLNIEHARQSEARTVDGWLGGPTDVTWDQDDNIYVSDGYINSRIAKYDQYGDWITSWGKYGKSGAQANENPYSIDNPHNLQADRDGNIYVADRGNRRIQVFDRDGKFLKFLFLNVPYDKTHHPVFGNLPPDPSRRPDQTEPWAICISPTTPQYLWAVDVEPGRLYKMTLDGKILGYMGSSGRRMGQFNWAHAIACPTEDTVFVADMNNWRVIKLRFFPNGKPNR